MRSLHRLHGLHEDSMRTSWKPVGDCQIQEEVADMLITWSVDALLANVMPYWPMCCIRNGSADTHYTVIS